MNNDEGGREIGRNFSRKYGEEVIDVHTTKIILQNVHCLNVKHP